MFDVLYSRLNKKLLSLSDYRTTEEPATEVEKSPVAEKQGAEDETTDANKETPADAQEEKEPEAKVYIHGLLLMSFYK